MSGAERPRTRRAGRRRTAAPLAVLTWAALTLLPCAGGLPAQEAARTDDAAQVPRTNAPQAARTDDAALDRLTAEVADQLRCPVCRNQSVLESSSQLARSMQGVIRERLGAGESPEEVKAYFVARYGDWILLKPRARGINLAIYLLPAALVLGGGLFVRARLKAWRGAGASAGEETRSAVPVEEGRRPAAADVEAGLGERDREWLKDAIRTG